jgi:hypothetical protein
MNSNFSIIIPTLWRCDRIFELLDELEKCNAVDEIILIDNNYSYSKNVNKQYTKIKLISNKENMYVNPSWNLGVKESKNTNIAILNDDLNFNSDVFDYIKNHIDKGLIGLCCSAYDPIDRNEPYEIFETEHRTWGWGCMIFLKKENYIEIPSALKIACGDDYLFHYLKCKKYSLKNLRIHGRISITSLSPEFLEIQQQDLENYKKITNG